MDRTFVIAEAGVNHNGSFELAMKLVDIAAEAGADYVKFQTFKADQIVSKDARKADYQVRNMVDIDDSQFGMLKKLEMPEDWHGKLMDYASSRGIRFMSTAFDVESLDFLDSLGLDFFKIPSGEITNKPYLTHVAKKGKPVIVSTGMATLEEVGNAIGILEYNGLTRDLVTILHCTSEYPAPFKDVNLQAMTTMAKHFNVRVGYSDHTEGIEVPIAAVALGAAVIEKHFTVDRNLPGPDHKASLEPNELKSMISAIRNVELAMSGSGRKVPSQRELKNLGLVRKSIHSCRLLQKGHILQVNDLLMKRPGNGISPMDIDKVIGRRLKTEILPDTQLRWENFDD